MTITLPKRGFVFWPVGNGDATTIVVDDSTIIQVDIRQLECADEDDDPRTPIVDELVELLPSRDKKRYLAAFVLTHPDEDHCQGFGELLDEATIGELWFSPRVFNEYKKDLCDDAKAFRDEALRRVKKTIKEKGNVSSGDRVRIIGYSDLLDTEEFKGFPSNMLTVPGNAITSVDGTDHGTRFSAFVHAPFKDDADGDRNDTSVAMQVTLKDGFAVGRAFLMGDLSYPVVNRIFEKSAKDDLKWDLFLAPHHCSKSVMYWTDDPDAEPELKQDLLDAIEVAGGEVGYIISSSDPIPSSNAKGDNPPHTKAADRYKEIVPTEFLCTGEHCGDEAPLAIVFSLNDKGLSYEKSSTKSAARSGTGLAEAIVAARGADAPPQDRVGFGAWA
jgi:hypothetical protein